MRKLLFKPPPGDQPVPAHYHGGDIGPPNAPIERVSAYAEGGGGIVDRAAMLTHFLHGSRYILVAQMSILCQCACEFSKFRRAL